jgi:hypothetical protein
VLTDRHIRNMNPGDKLADARSPGLRIHAGNKRKRWIYRFKDPRRINASGAPPVRIDVASPREILCEVRGMMGSEGLGARGRSTARLIALDGRREQWRSPSGDRTFGVARRFARMDLWPGAWRPFLFRCLAGSPAPAPPVLHRTAWA